MKLQLHQAGSPSGRPAQSARRHFTAMTRLALKPARCWQAARAAWSAFGTLRLRRLDQSAGVRPVDLFPGQLDNADQRLVIARS